MKSIGQRIAKGASWMVLFTFVGRILGFTSTVILARLLAPTDFGMVAMAMSIVYALELLNSFGFEYVLIQLKNADRSHYDTAWTLRIVFACLVVALLIFLAAPAEHFYNQAGLRTIIYCLAFGTAVEAFQNIGVVGFLKELEFQKEFMWRISVKITMFVTTVPLAFYLRNYWALVAGMIIGRIASVVLSYVMHSYRPRLSIAAWRELLGFSIWLSLSSVLTFFRLRSADFIIGRIAGAAQLGIFSIAYEIAHLVTTDLVAPITRAVFPGFAKMSHDLERLRDGYLIVIGATCLIAFPASLGIAAIAEVLVPVLLGEKWLDAVPIIKILALHGLYSAFHINNSAVYIALGRPKIVTVISFIQVAILLPLLVYSISHYGSIGAAYGYLGTVCMIAPLAFYVTLRVLKLTLRKFLGAFWRPLLSAVFMYFIVKLLIEYLGVGESLLQSTGRLLIAVVVGAVCYTILVTAFWYLSSRPAGAEREVWNIIARRLRNGASNWSGL